MRLVCTRRARSIWGRLQAGPEAVTGVEPASTVAPLSLTHQKRRATIAKTNASVAALPPLGSLHGDLAQGVLQLGDAFHVALPESPMPSRENTAAKEPAVTGLYDVSGNQKMPSSRHFLATADKMPPR
jgi:hypothetical protein